MHDEQYAVTRLGTQTLNSYAAVVDARGSDLHGQPQQLRPFMFQVRALMLARWSDPHICKAPQATPNVRGGLHV